MTDATNASRTMLYDIHMPTPGTTTCSRSLASHGGPYREVVPSSGVVGHTDPAVFGAAVPIAGIAGDQQAALFGQTCWEPGHAKNTYGTGCFLLSHTGAQATPSHAGLLTTVAASDERPRLCVGRVGFRGRGRSTVVAGQAWHNRHGSGE